MNLTKFTPIALALMVCCLAAPGREQHYRGKPFHVSIYHGEGEHVLTIHILTNGNMNLAYLDFKMTKRAK